MRVVVKTYEDGQPVPFIGRLRLDISNEDQLLGAADDIHDFVSKNFHKMEDEDGNAD